MYDTKNNLILFSERLKELRKSRIEKQEDLATALGVARSSISSYENGAAIPDIDTLTKIAMHYSVSTDYLLGLESSTTHDISYIHNETGLSEKAIDILQYYHHNTEYFEKDIKGLNNLIIYNDEHRFLRSIGIYTSTLDLEECDFKNKDVYEWYNWNNGIDVVPQVINPEFDARVHVDTISQSDILYYQVMKAFENTLYNITIDKNYKEKLVEEYTNLYNSRKATQD